MDKLKHYLTILVVFLIALGGAYLYLSRFDEPIEDFGSNGQLVRVEEQVRTDVHVIAVDIEALGNINLSTILSGKTSYLGLKSEDPAAPSSVMDGVEILQEIDTNRNGVIDRIDADYERLELMTFVRGGKQLRVLPMEQTGIRAIVLSPRYLKAVVEYKKDKPSMLVGHVIMSDGTVRNLWVVDVPERYFRKAP